ncbi:glycosyl transferase [Sporosarcina luteola]|uniref:glycosyl transferase n=1 Tax=Sporosarcina luteola TaxID=582850 RepID=UPI00203A8A9C|nr:glycosyl transferase [Sporosarcina luteola]MCM3742993.1 glycosyl transferase [Sporosarcina luteola]
MKKWGSFLVLGIITILMSTPLAYKLVGVVYRNRNLTGEYIPILNGFIHSLMLVGLMIFIAGIALFIKDNK